MKAFVLLFRWDMLQEVFAGYRVKAGPHDDKRSIHPNHRSSVGVGG